MIICKDYDNARLEAISALSYFDNKIKELSITYNEKDKKFIVSYKEFSEDEYDKIFGEE